MFTHARALTHTFAQLSFIIDEDNADADAYIVCDDNDDANKLKT